MDQDRAATSIASAPPAAAAAPGVRAVKAAASAPEGVMGAGVTGGAVANLLRALETGARTMRVLQAQMKSAEAMSASLRSRQEALEEACGRAERLKRALEEACGRAERARAEGEASAGRAGAVQGAAARVYIAEGPATATVAAAVPVTQAHAPSLGPGPAPAPAPAAKPAPAGPLPPAPPEDVHALHTLIDDLVARCAVLERDRAVASASERALLAGVHEELRDGLADLKRTIDSLQKTRLDEKQEALVAPVSASLGALSDLVSGLRDLSPAPGAGADGEAAAADDSVFDLREAIEGVADFLSRRAADRAIEWACQIAPDVPALVVGDRARLRQIALHVGHTAVRLAAAPGRVDFDVTVETLAEDHVAVRISAFHKGAGIDPALLDAGEGALMGVAPSPDGRTESAFRDGAGLAAARQLVERLGGRFGVESEQDARFRLWFTITWQRPDRRTAGRRTDNRLRVVSVSSSVGPVLDLSLGGARVQSKKRLEGRISIEISASTDSVTLEAEVAWSKRAGWRKFNSGLHFVDVTPEIARRLTRLSMEHRVRALMGGEA